MRLDHIQHVPVPVVVMTDVLLIQHRKRAHLEGGAEVLAIPVGHDVLAVRIDREPQLGDQVVSNCFRFLILACYQVIAKLDGVLRVRDLGRMQAPVDVDDRFSLAGQRPRLRFTDAAGDGETPRDVLVVVELREVLRR